MKKILLIIGICFSCSDDSELSTNNEILDNYYQDKEIEIVFENDPEQGINVVFLGDAYVRSDLNKDDSKYRYDGIKSIEFLFNSSPFCEYKEHFNAYIVYAESSIQITNNGIVTDYPFGSTRDNNDLTIITNPNAINDYILELKGRARTDNDLILMAVDGLESGSAFLGQNIAVYGTFESREFFTTSFNIMLHEVGHAFASLGDEYINPNLIPISTSLLPNIDTTNNLNSIKWNHFIGLDGYDDVGAFQGGNYRENGMWRPEQSSIMRGNIGSYFNAPSREAIVERIFNLRGLDYNFETFLNHDLSCQSNRFTNQIGNNEENKIEMKINDLPTMAISNCLLYHASIEQ